MCIDEVLVVVKDSRLILYTNKSFYPNSDVFLLAHTKQ
jgi:hypothetical protein